MKAKLVKVQAEDQEDFADLIGATGELRLLNQCSFLPQNQGDWLEMHHQKIIHKDNKIIVIETTLDNTFTFKIL